MRSDCWAALQSILVGALILAGSGCGGGGSGSQGNSQGAPTTPINPSSIDFSPYLSQPDKVYVEVPSNWDGEEDPVDPELIAFFSEPFQSDNDQLRESVFVYKTNRLDTRPEGLSRINIISTRATTVDGFAAVEEIYDAELEEAEELDLRFMQISFRLEGTTYGLLYVAERSQFPRNTDITRFMASRSRFGLTLIAGTETDSDVSDPGRPGIASDGQKFLVVSCRESDAFPYPTTLVGRLVRADRTVGSEFVIEDRMGFASTSCANSSYEAAFDGTQYWVTYIEVPNPDIYIAAKRISIEGTVLDSVPIAVSPVNSTSKNDPTIGFDGTRLLVVWAVPGAATSEVHGAFISTVGVVTPSFAIAADLNVAYSRDGVSVTPQLSYGDGQYMVIWGPEFFRDTQRPAMPIYGQLVRTDGSLVLPQAIEVRSDDGVGNPRYPQVAFDGEKFLVAWIEGELHPNIINDGSFSVNARKVSTSGELENGPSSSPGTLIAQPLLVAGSQSEVPKEFLKVRYYLGSYEFYWASANYIPESGIYGLRVDSSLSEIAAPKPVIAARSALLSPDYRFEFSEPNVASSGNRSLLVWPTREGVVEGWFEP